MSMIGELRQFPATLLPALRSEQRVAELVMDSEGGLSLDKAWHGLHYLLGNGDSMSLTAVMGGEVLDGPHGGYGPPQILTPDEVRQYAAELAATTEEDLREEFDPEAMMTAEIYPETWERGEEELEWLLGAFRDLRAFYQDAAKRGNGILFYLT